MLLINHLKKALETQYNVDSFCLYDCYHNGCHCGIIPYSSHRAKELLRMKIELNLFASLRRYMPHKAKGNSCSVEIAKGTRISELLEQLKVPTDAVKLVFLNRVHARGDEILKDGDRVGVFPPVAGG